MVSRYIDSHDELRHALHYWKNYNFVEGYLNANDAMQSISGSERLVEARASQASRWVLCPANNKAVKEAMFHTAAIWRWNSDLETGNFVRPGHGAETNVAESRIQWELNTYCQLSYGIDTQHDRSIWDVQKAFEAHASSLKGFNRTCKKRRAWQDGSGNPTTFVMSSNLVVRRATVSAARKAKFPYQVHPWIKAATEENPLYIANPDRPRMFELVNDQLLDIKDCTPPYIAKGDLVWISFAVEFTVGGVAWSSTFIPYEIVRVGRVSPDIIGGASQNGEGDTAPQQGLQAGLRVSMNADFPMHNITNTVPTSTVDDTPRTVYPLGAGPVNVPVPEQVGEPIMDSDESMYWAPSPPRTSSSDISETLVGTSPGPHSSTDSLEPTSTVSPATPCPGYDRPPTGDSSAADLSGLALVASMIGTENGCVENPLSCGESSLAHIPLAALATATIAESATANVTRTKPPPVAAQPRESGGRDLPIPGSMINSEASARASTAAATIGSVAASFERSGSIHDDRAPVGPCIINEPVVVDAQNVEGSPSTGAELVENNVLLPHGPVILDHHAVSASDIQPMEASSSKLTIVLPRKVPTSSRAALAAKKRQIVHGMTGDEGKDGILSRTLRERRANGKGSRVV